MTYVPNPNAMQTAPRTATPTIVVLPLAQNKRPVGFAPWPVEPKPKPKPKSKSKARL